jgi:hypothetical protein
VVDIKHELIKLNQRLQGIQAGQGDAQMAGSGSQLPNTIGALQSGLAQLLAQAQAAGVPTDGLVAPMNAAPAGGVGIGVQPGTSNAVVVAQYVIITNSGGWFIYDGLPALGNPPIAWATGGLLVDPYGNPLPYQFGITGNGVFAADNTLITPNGIFVYSSTPATGNLIGSWASVAGTDQFGNGYPQGLSVLQGLITGIGIDSTEITNSTFEDGAIDAADITNSDMVGGTATEVAIVFDTTGGQLLVYTTTTTTITQTVAGTYTFTPPSGVTSGKIEVTAAATGGNGGVTSAGGHAGGAGEYAQEPNYPLVPLQPYTYTVGAGTNGQSTGGGNAADAGDSFFDHTGVYAHGGLGGGAGGTGSTNTIHNNGGAGGAAAVNGGGSGGNSGNATAAGNNGIAGSGSGGGAAPAAQTGSGRGGAGGNTGAGGSNGSGPGGAGGGAGAGTSSTVLTKSYTPLYTGSYLGPDATSGANSLRSTSTMYQGGETASGGAANGNQRAVFGFNRTQIASDFSGYTITGCTIQLTNQHSWYNSGMTVIFDEYAGLPGTVPSTYPAGDYSDSVAQLTIAEGATKVFSLAASVGQRFVTGSTNGLGIGEPIAGTYPYNLNYYGYFSGGSSIILTLTGTKGSGGETAGNGADGQVKITYTSGSALIAALAPVAGTDVNGNAYAAGYTGPVNVFDPNQSPTAVEEWHSATLINGWTKQGFARYKLIGYNLMLLQLQINDSAATSGTFMNMPTGYAATQGQFPEITEFTNAAGTPGNAWIVQVNTGAAGALAILEWAKKSHQFVGNLIISLD